MKAIEQEIEEVVARLRNNVLHVRTPWLQSARASRGAQKLQSADDLCHQRREPRITAIELRADHECRIEHRQGMLPDSAGPVLPTSPHSESMLLLCRMQRQRG